MRVKLSAQPDISSGTLIPCRSATCSGHRPGSTPSSVEVSSNQLDLRPEQGHHLQCRRRRPDEPHGALVARPAMALQPRQVGRRHLLNMAGGRRRRHGPMFDVAADQISQIRTERSEPQRTTNRSPPSAPHVAPACLGPQRTGCATGHLDGRERPATTPTRSAARARRGAGLGIAPASPRARTQQSVDAPSTPHPARLGRRPRPRPARPTRAATDAPTNRRSPTPLFAPTIAR